MAENRPHMKESDSDGSTSVPSVIIDRDPHSGSNMQEGVEGIKTGELSVGSTSQSDRCRRAPQVDPAIKLLDEKVSVKEKLKLLNRRLLNRIAKVNNDGTVVVEVPTSIEPVPASPSLDFGPTDIYVEKAEEEELDGIDIQFRPPMNIVILIVGTRGDVQPFVAIGKRLQDYGHRVRLATHANFKEFVLTAGLEFYHLGGDPKILAEYMVKNKGFLPSNPSEISIQRKQIKEIVFSLLPACKEPDMDSGISFKADAIIANPPCYGHTHVAEALNIPIHIIFTMPWTPTSEFPHPLSRVNLPAGYRLSYHIVDSMIWLGIHDIINEFRKKKLKLRPVTYLSGSHGADYDLPHGYIWSPQLVPKPKDWGARIDVVGFCFLDLASNYVPPEPLVRWLEAGENPYILDLGAFELLIQTESWVSLEIVNSLSPDWGWVVLLLPESVFTYATV
ncbi:Sterol 3-beta-glucosyltransferase [Rhynchospora pubera]|uniref:sterol 3beta-glucosyltransferase n=1 Tax=Rhynchospora pubera TaxID=906938 RepID=A0AAV8GCH8_9POAL|nr:Sterol 3-beta-glucosyltransferase [Rhynchospora pubera]